MANTQEYWCYNHQKSWYKITGAPSPDFNDSNEFLEGQGYLFEPDILLGDEFNFIALYEHPHEEKYLFHVEIDNFSKFIYADTLPGMFFVLDQLTYLLNGCIRIIKLMESLQDE